MDAQDVSTDVAAVARIDCVPKILEVICRTTGLGFSAVARVTDTRWVACAVRDDIAFGLAPGGELDLGTTICNEIRQHHRPVVIDHVAADAAFCRHATPAKYGFQSYASFPIFRRDGRFFGTLCAIDPRPAQLNTPTTIDTFKLFAELIGLHLDAQDRAAVTEAALLTEREASKLREQFIAVLGHDLRNPLAAIQGAVDVIRVAPEAAGEMVEMVASSVTRMSKLIEDVLDFARGRLGAGLAVATAGGETGLQTTLQQVCDELQAARPTRQIRCAITIDRPIRCDPNRLGQMLSNLLANALTHGDASAPVDVTARVDAAGELVIAVANRGTIPPALMPKLFEPFSRGEARPGAQGLGLGLYIASEIARAHAGRLAATSADGQTRFEFRMPAGA